MSPSLFKQAEAEAKRLKLFMFGPSGIGKTVASLHMPAVALADPDKGSDFYAGPFSFKRIQTPDIDVINAAVDELIKDPTGFKTFVLDGMTKYNELLQEKHLKRLRVKKGNPAYTFQGVDYKPIKADMRAFVNRLIALDLNIVVTAQVKPEYSTDTGEFMKIIGTVPDAPKEIPYLFDVVLELKFGKDGTRQAYTIKDRTNKLPPQWEFSYQNLVGFIGLTDLEREPVQLKTIEALDKLSNRKTKAMFDGKELLTAGITTDTLAKLKIALVGMNETEVSAKLVEDYSVYSLFDLREDEGKLLLTDLTNK